MSSQYEDNEIIDEYEDDGVSPNQLIQGQVSEAVRESVLQENKVIHAAEQVNESTQQQVQQAKQKSVFADAKQPPVWEISDMTSNGSLRGFNIYNAFMQNNPYQYTFYGETVANRWEKNFQYILGPTNLAFVDATLSDRDIAWGYCLEYNPNGILWRVSAAGIPHPDDYDNFLEQNRIIEEATNRTLEENEPPSDTPQVIQASSGIEPRPLIPTSEQLERINNPYAGLLLPNGLSLNARVVKTSSTPSNGQWTLVFSSEGNYGNVILYDENKNVLSSCVATSGRIGVTNRSIEDAGPIPLGMILWIQKKYRGETGRFMQEIYWEIGELIECH